MIDQIKKYCNELENEFHLIAPERKQALEKISEYIRTEKKKNKPVNLIYICTHNSRRSHFGQIWGYVACEYYGVTGVHVFSGGTEATAFNENAINAIKRIGFLVKKITESNNPTYEVYHDLQRTPTICFSKVYDHVNNPSSDFAAIMTCGDAEENCPFIPGADLRISTMYVDPKEFDDTPQQDEQYDERCRQIARETFYIFSRLS